MLRLPRARARGRLPVLGALGALAVLAVPVSLTGPSSHPGR
jgi:hypothetical protein